ncbi:MAG: MBL fold metallo-hydrolase [Bacteroidetes bacterium]|nr:MBL fold metallo-hydrolase [Bacteroidota bacterium]
MKITFHGAAQTVTGSKHLITTERNKQLLLDCGLFQNSGGDNAELNRHLGFDPSGIDYMILSHAHIDHSGNIPFLVKSGYSGPIYCTPATLDLCNIMLADSAHIQENDIKYLNKRRAKSGKRPLDELYNVDDVVNAMKQFVAIPLDQWEQIDPHIKFLFTDAGHILGSAAVNLVFEEPTGATKVFFSGDIGRSNDMILRKPQDFPQADYIIMESTYGDRLHESSVDAELHLFNIVKDTCVARKGKLIIPAFSLGRTQEIVYSLNRLYNNGLIPRIPVYVDSPLAISATSIMRKHKESFNPETVEYMKKDDDPFGFETLHYVREVEDSKALNDFDEPCIIISASGMLEAGRIKHHVKNNISNEKNTILIIGYVPPGSLGGKLIEGTKEVKIFGDIYPVNAQIAVLDSYSAHADYKEMMEYLRCQNPQQVKRLFLVHGEPEAQLKFKEHLNGMGFSDIVIPIHGESFPLD